MRNNNEIMSTFLEAKRVFQSVSDEVLIKINEKIKDLNTSAYHVHDVEAGTTWQVITSKYRINIILYYDGGLHLYVQKIGQSISLDKISPTVRYWLYNQDLDFVIESIVLHLKEIENIQDSVILQ